MELIVMSAIKKIFAAAAAISMASAPAMAASSGSTALERTDLRAATQVAESEDLFGLDGTMGILLGLLAIGALVGIIVAVSDSSP
jgi:hypothetical protein